MKIIVQIHNGGGSISLHACTDNEKDEKYTIEPKDESSYGKHEVNAIDFLHSNSKCITPSIRSAVELYSLRYNIQLESTVKFKTFCEQLAASSFGKKENWGPLRHNCALGVLHALKLAGIHIKIPSPLIFNRVGGSSLDILPGFSLSPLDLFGYITEYKKQQLNNADIDFKLELASTALHFWNRRNNDKVQQELVNTINNEIAPLTKTHLAHRDYFLNLIHATADYLLKTPDAPRMSPHENASFINKSRRFIKPHREGHGNDGMVATGNISISAALLLSAFKYLGVNPTVRNAFAVISLAAICVSAYKTYKGYQKYWYDPDRFMEAPTKLSEAIIKLAEVKNLGRR